MNQNRYEETSLKSNESCIDCVNIRPLILRHDSLLAHLISKSTSLNHMPHYRYEISYNTAVYIFLTCSVTGIKINILHLINLSILCMCSTVSTCYRCIAIQFWMYPFQGLHPWAPHGFRHHPGGDVMECAIISQNKIKHPRHLHFRFLIHPWRMTSTIVNTFG